MKKIVLLSFFTLVITSVMWAQPEQRIEAMRVAFITKHLNLTPDEAATFWPLYNEFRAQIEKIKRDQRDINGNINNMSDKELEQFVGKRFELEQQELDLKKSYFQKFIGVLSIRKVARLQSVERNFKEEILKEIQKRRQNRNSNRKGYN